MLFGTKRAEKMEEPNFRDIFIFWIKIEKLVQENRQFSKSKNFIIFGTRNSLKKLKTNIN